LSRKCRLRYRRGASRRRWPERGALRPAQSRRVADYASSARPPMHKGEVVMATSDREILGSVLDEWKSGVDAHDPKRVASYFTGDTIFQGLHPYSVGPIGVAEYYEAQPIGMTAAYEIRETRRLADDVLLGYLSVDFTFTDRPVVSVNLSIILRNTAEGWLI